MQEKINWNDIIDYITRDISTKYPYLYKEDVRNAANEACWRAFLKFDPEKSENIVTFVKAKGSFLTIDILRQENRIFRADKISNMKIYNESDLATNEQSDFSDETLDIVSKKRKQYCADSYWFDLSHELCSIEKKILYMKYIGKYSTKEISKILGKEIFPYKGYYRYRLIRGIVKRLKKKLKENIEGTKNELQNNPS